MSHQDLKHLLDLDHWQEIRVALLRNRARTALTAFGEMAREVAA